MADQAKQNAQQAAEQEAQEAMTQTEKVAPHKPRLLGKSYFQRKKSCPFSGENAKKIDYKDPKLLQRYVSPYGKMIPAHVTGVSAKAQRELTRAVKRSRMIALMPFNQRDT